MPSSNPLVLVADDEPTMLELVARHLKTMADPKLEVIEASDGDQAWRLAMERLPDLVVLDVMMPGMSGWEVCRKIRESVALAHTGVVMLTGIGENLNQMTSPLYGADAYVDKPFEFTDLDRKVREALEARASQRGGVERPHTNGVAGLAKAVKRGAAAATKSAKKAVKKAAKKLAKVASAVVGKKAAAKKAPAKKAPAKKGAGVAKKGAAAAKKGAAKKAPAKKGAAKKAPTKKAAKKKSSKR